MRLTSVSVRRRVVRLNWLVLLMSWVARARLVGPMRSSSARISRDARKSERSSTCSDETRALARLRY